MIPAALRDLSQIRKLQIAVAIGGVIPVAAGLAGMLDGIRMVDDVAASASLDSHYRYLSGLLFGIGVSFWALIPNIEKRATLFRLLTILVFTGGLGRLTGLWIGAVPSLPMLAGLAMELIVTPLLCLWQARIADPTE